jgi:hypothetical protein
MLLAYSSSQRVYLLSSRRNKHDFISVYYFGVVTGYCCQPALQTDHGDVCLPLLVKQGSSELCLLTT